MRVTGKAVLGWDMSAALALAHALGLNSMVVAELLPELEAVMGAPQRTASAESQSGPGW